MMTIASIVMASAVALALIPLAAMPIGVVGVGGLVGLVLALAAVVTGWRWPATIAACVFLADYAAALAIAAAPLGVIPPMGFGLALLLLLQSVDLACRTRGAAWEWRVVRSEVGRWIALGLGALGVASLALTLGQSLVALVPPAIAPLLAGAGALGAVLIVAGVIVRAGKVRDAAGSPGR